MISLQAVDALLPGIRLEILMSWLLYFYLGFNHPTSHANFLTSSQKFSHSRDMMIRASRERLGSIGTSGGRRAVVLVHDHDSESEATMMSTAHHRDSALALARHDDS